MHAIFHCLHPGLVYVLFELINDFITVVISNAGFFLHSGICCMFQMHEVVNGESGMVYSKDMLSEVGLAYREVIHSGTPEALEKTS